MRRKATACCCLLSTVAIKSVKALCEPELSFKPPFFSEHGAQHIQHFVANGRTLIHEDHVSLTPNAADMRGELWSNAFIGGDEVSVEVEFRVSGGGTGSYGEKLKLYAVSTGRPALYENHHVLEDYGGTEGYSGFKVEFAASGNDHFTAGLTIYGLENSPNPVVVPGCSVVMKPQTGLEHAFESSRLRLKYSPSMGQLDLEVDRHNSGRWVECISKPVSLPAGWGAMARVGLGAESGVSGGSFDIMSYRSHRHVQEAMQEEHGEGDNDIDVVRSHLMRKLYNAYDGMNSILDKQVFLEDRVRKHLVTLEDVLSRQVIGTDNRIQAMERYVTAMTHNNIQALLAARSEEWRAQAEVKAGTVAYSLENDMQLPFYVLMAVIVIGGAASTLLKRSTKVTLGQAPDERSFERRLSRALSRSPSPQRIMHRASCPNLLQKAKEEEIIERRAGVMGLGINSVGSGLNVNNVNNIPNCTFGRGRQ